MWRLGRPAEKGFASPPAATPFEAPEEALAVPKKKHPTAEDVIRLLAALSPEERERLFNVLAGRADLLGSWVVCPQRRFDHIILAHVKPLQDALKRLQFRNQP